MVTMAARKRKPGRPKGSKNKPKRPAKSKAPRRARKKASTSKPKQQTATAPKPPPPAEPAKKKGRKPMAAKKERSPAQKAATKRMLEARAGGGHTHSEHHRQPASNDGPDTALISTVGPIYPMNLQTVRELSLDPKAVGQLWVGFIQEIRDPCDDEINSMQREFPPSLEPKHPGQCWQGCGCVTHGMDSREYARYRNHRGVGMSMAKLRLAGNAFIKMQMSEQEIVNWYRRAVQAAAVCAPTVVVGATGGQWTSPLAAPSRVTDQFGAPRDGGKRAHRGVDLAAAKGTPVVAPYRMKVTEISSSGDAGLYVQAVNERADGRFPELGTLRGVGEDDSGWIQTFMHLEAVDPKIAVGSVIERGAPFATSGDSGSAGQPHLHWQLEWYDDGTWLNDRLFINPLTYVSEGAIANPGFASPLPNGPGFALTAPRRTDDIGIGLMGTDTGRNIIINGNAVVGVGRDNVRINAVQNQLDAQLGFTPMPTSIPAVGAAVAANWLGGLMGTPAPAQQLPPQQQPILPPGTTLVLPPGQQLPLQLTPPAPYSTYTTR